MNQVEPIRNKDDIKKMYDVLKKNLIEIIFYLN